MHFTLSGATSSRFLGVSLAWLLTRLAENYFWLKWENGNEREHGCKVSKLRHVPILFLTETSLADMSLTHQHDSNTALVGADEGWVSTESLFRH